MYSGSSFMGIIVVCSNPAELGDWPHICVRLHSILASRKLLLWAEITLTQRVIFVPHSHYPARDLPPAPAAFLLSNTLSSLLTFKHIAEREKWTGGLPGSVEVCAIEDTDPFTGGLWQYTSGGFSFVPYSIELSRLLSSFVRSSSLTHYWSSRSSYRCEFVWLEQFLINTCLLSKFASDTVGSSTIQDIYIARTWLYSWLTPPFPTTTSLPRSPPEIHAPPGLHFNAT